MVNFDSAVGVRANARIVPPNPSPIQQPRPSRPRALLASRCVHCKVDSGCVSVNKSKPDGNMVAPPSEVPWINHLTRKNGSVLPVSVHDDPCWKLDTTYNNS